MGEAHDDLKDTKIGPIPKNWDVVPLGQVATLTMGQSPPSTTYNTNGIGLPFLQGKAEFGNFYPTPKKWCSKPNKVAVQDSILISVRAPVGDVNIAKEKYCIGRGLASIYGLASLNNYFLFYLLTFAKSRIEDRGTGSTFKSINKGVLQHFPMPLPPLPEQRRIAHVLNTIRRTIEAQDQVVEAVKELKRSLMERLFTYGPYEESAPTKETEIGEIPEHWEVTRLKKLAERPTYGYTQSASSEPVGPKFLRITDITERGVNWATVPYCECGQGDFLKYQIVTDDIFFARTGATTGKSFIVKDCPEAVFASYLIRVQAKDSVLPDYLFYYFNSTSYWEQITFSKSGSTQPGVNATRLSNLLVPIAPVDEQAMIASNLSTANDKLIAEEGRKTALQALFNSMLHNLMTGQIRVDDPEIDHVTH